MEAFAAYSLTIFLRRNFAAEKVKFALWNWRCSKKKRTLRPEIKKGVKMDSKVVILLPNCMDPLKLTSVVWQQKGKSKKFESSMSCNQEVQFSHVVDIHDQFKTSYKTNRKSVLLQYLKSFSISWIQLLLIPISLQKESKCNNEFVTF